ncbi:MAG: hypothetical protein ACRCX2_14865 [Paraclostridium sp.]
MLNRDNVIRSALRYCGESYTYNSNTSQTYKLASDILEDVIRNFATRLDLKFNSTSIILTKDGSNEFGENRFNLPVDFLNKIRFIDTTTARIENEFVYDTANEVKLQYCRNINFNEYPDYLSELMSYTLALKLSESVEQFNVKLNLLNMRVKEEETKIYKLEYSPKVRVV